MKFENLSEQDREIFLHKKYKPVNELFGEEILNWHYYDHYVDSDKKKEIFVEDLNLIHKIPVKSHSYIFRFKMPPKPCIYSLEDKFSDDELTTHVFRFTVGERPFLFDEEHIKKIARGEITADKQLLVDLNRQMDKTFTFNTWKIPFCHVTVDEYNFVGAWSVYQGPELIKVERLEKKLIAEQENKRSELLDSVKATIKKFPDYLSIVRRTTQGKISIEEAVKEAVSKDVIKKGI